MLQSASEMISVPGFLIKEEIYTGKDKSICHALREKDQLPVMLKIISGEFSEAVEMSKLRREYELTRSLSLPGIIKALDLIDFSNGVALVTEDFGGIELSTMISNGAMPVKEFLRVAIELADIISQLHKQQVVHKDIKPENILINPATDEIKLIDFGIAMLLSQETVGIVNHNNLEGTLYYMSPEQTGRMNRSIDYRTDLYSLGVTLYEMITGQLPFISDDPLEIVHAHLAKYPKSPSEINPSIPPMISAIIMKLMDKSPEQRYQSAAGLKADLEKCEKQWNELNRIDAFEIGSEDFVDRFQIPQKLYGRDNEIHQLMEAFDESSGGATVLALVSGFSGIGKSVLIQEIHKPIVAKRGYFISGKFDQFQRDIPYRAIIDAFRSLILQLLSENDEQIKSWREKLLRSLGANGSVIIEVIPEVELIMGEQSPVVELTPSESQNRFNLVFLQFVQTFAKQEHPLVLFLDDLQWTDTPSLKLLELLVTDEESHHLLLIGAYRDNEVNAMHPLMKTIAGIRERYHFIKEISLHPLKAEHLNILVADTMRSMLDESKSLADLVLSKTGGNPFFVNEFLKSLYREKLITFSDSSHEWKSDIEKIKQTNITDNVVELMSNKIKQLDERTQWLCQCAACIGNKFDLQTLATVNEKSLQETAKDLWQAIQEGLILPIGTSYRLAGISRTMGGSEAIEYRFLHDRVQQAAYSMISDDDKKMLHLKIGRLLLNSFSEEEKEERIFDLVNQFNLGSALITDETEKINVATLNLFAGKKAKTSAAYDPAFKYLSAGISMLPGDSWQSHYNLALDLYNEGAEAAYLSGNLEEMERLTNIVFQNSKEVLHRVKAYIIKIQAYVSVPSNEEALNTALEALKSLGVKFPSNPNQLHIIAALVKTKLQLRGKSANKLMSLPSMKDPLQSAIMEVLSNAASPAYFAKPSLFPLLVFKQINLSVKFGNHVHTGFAYSTYGIVMCGSTNEFDEGQKFGQLAIRLMERFSTWQVYAKIHFVNGNFIHHWKHHYRESVPELMEAYQKGLETGDFLFASYSAFNRTAAMYYMGNPLQPLKKEMDEYAGALQKIKQNLGLGWLNIYRQTIANLTDPETISADLIGEDYDERIQKPLQEKGKDSSGLSVYYMNKTILNYLFDNTAEALKNGEQSEKLIENLLASIHHANVIFFNTLAMLRACETETGGMKNKLLRHAKKNIKKIKMWAKSVSVNHAAKQFLLEGELKRLHGDDQMVITLYQKATAAARTNGFTHEEAISNELLSRLYFKKNDESNARKYLLECRRLYLKWGALAKVKWLDEKYKLKPQAESTDTRIRAGVTIESTHERSGTQSNVELDIVSLLKASQSVSSEVQLSEVLKKVMHIAIENAGAARGMFIMEKDGKLVVEAEAKAGKEEITVLQSRPVEENDRLNDDEKFLPVSIINYTARTKENVLLKNGSGEGQFISDPYILKNKTKSVLCAPLIVQQKLLGIMYLENNLITDAFTPERLTVLRLLSTQAGISIENALLYESLEQKVIERTSELQKALTDLRDTQSQLFQSEKMASLGQLTAGVAHELNNPINFVSGNIKPLERDINDLLGLLKKYDEVIAEKKLGDQFSAIEKYKRESDVAFTIDEINQLLKGIEEGSKRTAEIVKGLRNFSRLDEHEMKKTNINEDVETTLMLLQNKLYDRIEVVKNYGEIPEIDCFPGQINQVLMNILSNAIQAIQGEGKIYITTSAVKDNIKISIRDTGKGMPEGVRKKIFEPFFTTKKQGEGTGLGLSISYGIIERHKGHIEVESEEGKGTEFNTYLPIVNSYMDENMQ